MDKQEVLKYLSQNLKFNSLAIQKIDVFQNLIQLPASKKTGSFWFTPTIVSAPLVLSGL